MIAARRSLLLALATLFTTLPLLAAAEHWVGTWASAPRVAVDVKLAGGTTLREVVHVSLGGETVRVRFSNLYGTNPLVIEAAQIAQRAKGAAVVAGTGKPLTFHGLAAVTIPPGALVVSDGVAFHLAPLSDLTVSFYLPNPSGPVTEHELGNATSFEAPGNVVASDVLDSPSTVKSWYYLNGVDTVAADAAAVITLGDSITDGSKSTVDTNQRWPDELARRLQADPKLRKLSVLNEGISGNKVLRDGAGVNALARFDRDVLAQSGARYLLILEGINDIGQLHSAPELAPAAAELIAAYEQMIQRAHTHGMAVIGCTLTPYHGAGYSTERGEAVRTAVNVWIRTGGAFDGVVDFDAAVRDPQHPNTFLPAVDPGDHLHPNDAGYKLMGDAIDLKLFTRKPKQP